jgi:hypothetical protein
MHFLERWAEWRLVIAIMALGYATAVWGFLTLPPGWRHASAWPDALYRGLQLFFFELDLPPGPVGRFPPWPLEIGRWLIVVGGVVAMAKIAVAILEDRFVPVRMRLRPPDVVFCGLNETALHVAAGEASGRLVAIAGDPFGMVATRFKAMGAVVHGDPSAAAALRRVNAAKTRRCLYVWADTDEAAERIVESAGRLIDAERSTKEQPVHIVAGRRDVQTLADVPEDGRQRGAHRFEVTWISPHMLVARAIIDRHPPDIFWSNQARRPPRIHVLVVGTTDVCRELVLHITRNVYPTPGVTRVTAVGDGAIDTGRRLLDRYSALDPDHPDACLFPRILPLVELQFFDARPAGLPWSLVESWHHENPVTCAYVDVGDDGATQAACRRVRQLLERLEANVPIVAHLRDDRRKVTGVSIVSTADVLRRREDEPYLGARLDQRAILLDYCFDPTNHVPAIEDRAASERARADALRGWRRKGEWARTSSRHAADHIAVKLRAVRGVDPGAASATEATLGSLDAALEQHLPDLVALEHRRYCAERLLDGWLPIDDARWERARVTGTQDALRELRLHGSLTADVEASDREKAERLIRHIPWILGMTAADRGGASPQPQL